MLKYHIFIIIAIKKYYHTKYADRVKSNISQLIAISLTYRYKGEYDTGIDVSDFISVEIIIATEHDTWLKNCAYQLLRLGTWVT